MKYDKAQINYNIRSLLEEGKSNADALDLFLMMNMVNDLTDERPSITKGPSPYEVHMNLVGNDVIEKDDFQLELVKGNKSFTQKLIVKLSPMCTLYAEMNYFTLHVTINKKNMTCMYLKSYRAEDVAHWIIRQKQKIDKYMETWNAVLEQACKKAKRKRIASLGIRAIFEEAMKDYPQIKYEFVEQKRRIRIKVMIPNTHLGVFIDAWWGSYRERLPQQIESLKLIIEAHAKSILTTYFVYH